MNRSTVILLLVLLTLGAITYFVLPFNEERESSYETMSPEIRIDSASVVKVRIIQPGKSITLENVGGKWMIVSPVQHPADANLVRQFIGKLSKFRVGSLISSNPNKQQLFQVDSSGTQLLIVDRAGNEVSMVVGKMGPSFTEVYFRMPDSRDVYLGEGIDTWSINKDVREWRDKSILSMPSEAVKEVSYTVGKRMYAFSHDSAGWKSGEKNVDMNPLLSTIANLRADDFVDSTIALPPRAATIALTGNETTSLSLHPILPDSSKYYLHSSRSPQLYVVSKWTAQQLMKPLENQSASTRAPQIADVEEDQPAVVTSEPQISAKSKESVNQEKVTEPPPPPVTTEKKPVAKEPQPSRTGVSDFDLPTKFKVTKKFPKRDSGGTATDAESGNKEGDVTQSPPPAAEKLEEPVQPTQQSTASDEDGDLVVHTVRKGETMTTIAQKYQVKVEQILKWNLLNSIAVKPGQELYIYRKQ